jgi:hypothetical protein
MIKLMKFITGMSTTIGQQIKILGFFLMFIILCACPREEYLQYDYVFNNETDFNLEIKLGTRENQSRRNHILKPKRLNYTYLSLSFVEFENPKDALNNGLQRYPLIDLFVDDSIVVTWERTETYEKEFNHFYNINAWKIIDSNPSSFVDGTFIFTIYPEDIEQDETITKHDEKIN